MSCVTPKILRESFSVLHITGLRQSPAARYLQGGRGSTCDIEMTVCGIQWLCCTVAHPLQERGGPGEASKGRASSWPEGWPTGGRSFPAATLMVLTEN